MSKNEVYMKEKKKTQPNMQSINCLITKLAVLPTSSPNNYLAYLITSLKLAMILCFFSSHYSSKQNFEIETLRLFQLQYITKNTS